MKKELEARLVPEYSALENNQKGLERKYHELEPYLRLKNKPDTPVTVSMREGQLHIEPRFGNPSLRGRLTIISRPDGKRPADVEVTMHGFYAEGLISGLPFKILLSKHLLACDPKSE